MLSVFCLVFGAALLVFAESNSMDRVVATLKESPFYQRAAAEYRQQRVSRGLSPEVVPHSEYVRMRDGTLLWTTYWDPRLDPHTPAPTVLVRSPYGILGTQNMADLYLPFGYVAVEQNQRGTGDSKGDYCFWMTSRFDGLDTMSWITTQQFSNGQVFQIGASADGILSTMDIKIPQPALAGQWLMITTSDPYTTLFQNGMAVREALAKDWLGAMQLYRPKLPAGTYYNTALRNEGFGSHYTPPGFNCDAFFDWSNITVSGEDFLNVNFPAIHTGGWYDIFLAPQLRTFRNYDTNSSEGALGQQQLFIGPRGHCFFEDTVSFPDDRFAWLWSYERSLDIFKDQTTQIAREAMPPSPKEFPAGFYPGEAPHLKHNLYVMGPDPRYKTDGRSVTGMYWTSLETLPSTNPYKLFFGPNRNLNVAATSTSSISFKYDPTNPTPTNGGNNLFLRCGPQNQTSNDLRGDNVFFDSQPFAVDTAILGAIVVNLRVSTSANDTDFVVRISDLYPGNQTSMLLGDNIVRMRWRESRQVESQTVPYTEYVINLLMWDLAYVFNAGHSIRVAITSSNYPRYSANPNNDLLVYQGGPTITAINTIHFGPDSWVELPTVPISALPKYGVV